ncbi:MAG TPA: SDR family oxidoreductase [Candidatus Limnocylindrales bacterium]|jgi:NAD(P)-dependent dehydrogenase (short-subunit alcohol dehydrogenase family)|nr:SDR family oxidoreductase [Candidatus Limnocylindrales bacterium]
MFQADLMKGRTILVTGGGTGLGRSMALRFAELGANLFLVARREQPLKETAEAIRAKGVRAAYAAADVRDFAAVGNALAAAEKEFERPFGGIDTLVNNAAGNFIARTEKLSPNAFNAVLGIVLQGSFHCTLALGRKWIAAKQPGNILNIVTTYAAVNSGSGYVVPSACAKAGVLALTRSLAVEWARYHIRLNAIAPGPFPTEGAWSRLLPSKELEERAKAHHPMKRFGRHEELANLAAYLLSAQAEYVNGECVVIDGGLWLRGAGEFNDFVDLPDAAWDMMEAARKK